MNRKRFVLLGAAAALAACATAEEQPTYAGDPETGREVAQNLCASCHAIDVTGVSANPGAPPFRDVLAKYDAKRLERDLDQAVSISHLQMPTFYFGEHHAADLVAYLKTIQAQPYPRPPG